MLWKKHSSFLLLLFLLLMLSQETHTHTYTSWALCRGPGTGLVISMSSQHLHTRLSVYQVSCWHQSPPEKYFYWSQNGNAIYEIFTEYLQFVQSVGVAGSNAASPAETIQCTSTHGLIMSNINHLKMSNQVVSPGEIQFFISSVSCVRRQPEINPSTFHSAACVCGGLQGVSDVDTCGHMWTHVLSDAPLEQMLLHVSEQMFASNLRGKWIHVLQWFTAVVFFLMLSGRFAI